MNGAWSGFIVVPYLAVGIYFAARHLAIKFLVPKSVLLDIPHPDMPDMVRMREVAHERGARDWLDGLFSAAFQVIVWPVRFRATHRDPSMRGAIDASLRRSYVVRENVWLLFTSTSIALLVGVSGHHWYLRLATYAVIVAILSYLLWGIIQPRVLRLNLCRTVPNPYLQFGLIALSDFVALTVAASILLRWPPNTTFQWNTLWLEARQILGFGHVLEIWRNRSSGIVVILIAVTGLAVYGLLGELRKPWLFRRTDSDRADIAVKLLTVGDYCGAEKWLNSFEGDEAGSIDRLWAQALGAIYAGRPEEALSCAQAVAAVNRAIAGTPHDDDDGRCLLLEWTDFESEINGCGLFDFLIESGISDACLSLQIATLMTRGYPKRGDALPVNIPDRRYPLTTAAFRAVSGNYLEAVPLLEAAPMTNIESMIAKYLISEPLAIASAMAADPMRGFLAAMEASQTLLRESQYWPIESIPLWLRNDLIGDIDQRLETFGSEDFAALTELRRALGGA